MDFKVNFKDLKSSNEYDKDKNPYKSFPHFVDPLLEKISANSETYKISKERTAVRLLGV